MKAIRSRLQLMLMAPGLVAVTLAVIVLGLLLPRLVRQSVGESLQATLDVLAPLVRAESRLRGEALQRRVLDVAGLAEVRLTVIGEDGFVLADSDRTWAQVRAMDSHGDRPEVARARAAGEGMSVRRSATTGIRYIYTTRTLRTPDGQDWVLRLARPVDELQTLYAQLAGMVILALAGSGLGAAGVYLWLHRRFFSPFSRLLGAAELVAADDPAFRVTEPQVAELAVLARSLNRLAGRVEEQVSDKETERRQLEEILAGLPEGVLVTDHALTPVYVNPAFFVLLGLTPETAPVHVFELAREPRLLEMASTAVGGTSVPETEITAEPRTLSLRAIPLEALGGALVMLSDVTELTRLHRIRRDFVANLSHELKTPLAIIRGAAETLLEAEDADTEVRQRFVGRIVEQGYRLEDLLEDLLTLSRLESPEGTSRSGSVDLGTICTRSVESLEEVASKHGVSLRTVLQRVPALVGDPWAIERMVVNLVVNGIKYNEPGGRVVVRVDRDPAGVRIEVEDDGIGVPRDEQARIFERFYRVDKGRGRGEGGSGLGLAIVKHVAHYHGGRVTIDSERGEGSTFTVFLPVHGPVRPATG